MLYALRITHVTNMYVHMYQCITHATNMYVHMYQCTTHATNINKATVLLAFVDGGFAVLSLAKDWKPFLTRHSVRRSQAEKNRRLEYGSSRQACKTRFE